MFEAFLLVCLASNPSDCFELEDTRGPYNTKNQCIERSVEMRKAIKLMPDHVTQGYKCAEVIERLPRGI